MICRFCFVFLLRPAIQFGYVCFFSVVFPFAPLCALLYNLLMVRLGAYKLCRLTRRPLARKSSGLGIWLHVLQLMSLIAVLTNCALIAITSTQLRSLFPEVTETTKILVIFGFEHVVILLKIAIAIAIPDVTKEVRLHRRKEKVRRRGTTTQRRRRDAARTSTGRVAPGRGAWGLIVFCLLRAVSFVISHLAVLCAPAACLDTSKHAAHGYSTQRNVGPASFCLALSAH